MAIALSAERKLCVWWRRIDTTTFHRPHTFSDAGLCPLIRATHHASHIGWLRPPRRIHSSGSATAHYPTVPIVCHRSAGSSGCTVAVRVDHTTNTNHAGSRGPGRDIRARRLSEEVGRHEATHAVHLAHIEAVLVHVAIDQDHFARLEAQFHLQLVVKQRERVVRGAWADVK